MNKKMCRLKYSFEDVSVRSHARKVRHMCNLTVYKQIITYRILALIYKNKKPQ